MQRRRLGDTELSVSPLGFGAVKIGRTGKLRYPTPFELPDDAAVAALLHGVVDLGVNLIDTAPAYGLSEERIGRHLAGRRGEVVLTTKAGETFDEATGRSRFDFSGDAIVASVERSLRRLKTDAVDVVLLHSDGEDLRVLRETGAAAALERVKRQGKTRLIGMSGKTPEGTAEALAWADVVMVAFNAGDTSHAAVMAEAKRRGVGVLVKKGLAAGHLGPGGAGAAVEFLMQQSDVDSAVIGTLSLEHMKRNLEAVPPEVSETSETSPPPAPPGPPAEFLR